MSLPRQLLAQVFLFAQVSAEIEQLDALKRPRFNKLVVAFDQGSLRRPDAVGIVEYDEVIRSFDLALAPVLENRNQATTFGDLRHGKARIDQLKEGWHQVITDDRDTGEGVRFDSGAADNKRNADASFEHKALAVGQVIGLKKVIKKILASFICILIARKGTV